MRWSNESPKNTIAAIGAMTAAIKAQRALESAGIPAQVVSLSPAETRHGCAYGVSYAADRHSSARQALRLAHVSVSEYLQKGGSEP